MDPFSALSLAGNIIQFVDFGIRLLSEAHEIYQSSSGSAAGILEIESVYQDLSNLTARLNVSAISPSKPSGISLEEKALVELAGSCKRLADELLATIKDLKVDDGPYRKWRSFHQGLRTLWKKEKLDAIQKRLDNFRKQLSLHLLAILRSETPKTNFYQSIRQTLIVIRDEQSDLLQEVKTLCSESRFLNADRGEQLKRLAQDLQDARMEIARAGTAEKLDQLFEKFSALTVRASVVAAEHAFLKSLYFQSLKVRLERIPVAYSKTFDWIFNPSDIELSPQFYEWLRSENGVYWISGKAGSGKSTLMKYLIGHAKTLLGLKEWAHHETLIIGNYFFWSAGTTLQKSLEGLLRSLLYEILRHCPNLIPAVCPSRWLSADRNEMDHGRWSFEECSDVMERVINQDSSSVKFCFFVDGLDEFEGDHMEVIQTLKALTKAPNIKICLSSRPWNVFKDAYGRGSGRRLALQDWNRPDIEVYVRNKLDEHIKAGSGGHRDNQVQRIIEEIVERSNGVFLWVFLVVRSLNDGFTNGDSIPTLQARLRGLPRDLEPFFQHMLDQIDEIYREQMAMSFKYTLDAIEPLTLLAHSFLDEPDPDLAFKTELKALNPGEIRQRHSVLERRINARCKGLLEVYADSSVPFAFGGHRVDFFHRTVRDFLKLKESQAMLVRHVPDGFNASFSICRAYLILIKTMTLIDHRTLPKHLDLLMYYARKVEVERGISDMELFDELEQVIKRLSAIYQVPILTYTAKSQEACLLDDEKKACLSFFEFAVANGLSIYTKQRLRDETFRPPDLSQPILRTALQPCTCVAHQEVDFIPIVTLLLNTGEDPNSSLDNSRPATPLEKLTLLYTSRLRARYSVWGTWLIESGSIFSSKSANDHRLQMLELLLRHGANPNAQHNQTTIWSAFLGWIYSRPCNELSSRSTMYFYFLIMDKLLGNGADMKAIAFSSSENPRTAGKLEISLDDVIELFPSHLAVKLKRRVRYQSKKRRRNCCCNIMIWPATRDCRDETTKPLLFHSEYPTDSLGLQASCGS